MLVAGTEFLWHAFWELTTDRSLGFGGEGRIPSAAVRSFATSHDIVTPDDFAWFLAVIREMDAEYLGIRSPTKAQVVDEVDISNHRGIRGLLQRLAKKSPAKVPTE